MYIYNKALNLNACNKIRRATDIISHSPSEKGSINASWWLNVGCFTACIGVHCSSVELDKVIWFRFQPNPL